MYRHDICDIKDKIREKRAQSVTLASRLSRAGYTDCKHAGPRSTMRGKKHMAAVNMATVALGFQISASATQMAGGINTAAVELQKLGSL